MLATLPAPYTEDTVPHSCIEYTGHIVITYYQETPEFHLLPIFITPSHLAIDTVRYDGVIFWAQRTERSICSSEGQAPKTQRSVNDPGNISFVDDPLKLLVLHVSRFWSGMSPTIRGVSGG